MNVGVRRLCFDEREVEEIGELQGFGQRQSQVTGRRKTVGFLRRVVFFFFSLSLCVCLKNR